MSFDQHMRAIAATALFLLFIFVSLVWCALLPKWRIWMERLAIAKRDAEQAKREADMRKWGLLNYPLKPMRVSNAEIDPARRTGQFSIPNAFRDMKGVQR